LPSPYFGIPWEIKECNGMALNTMEYHRVSWNVMEYHGVRVAYVQPALGMHSDDHLGRPTMELPARTKSNPNVHFALSVTVFFVYSIVFTPNGVAKKHWIWKIRSPEVDAEHFAALGFKTSYPINQ
jgi:hypothetical protein